MLPRKMFGFRKKQCSVCQINKVINVGKPIGHLCEIHLLDTYKVKFFAHQGRKLIIPPASPDKYISYQFETIASMRSYGLSANDLAPVLKLFSAMPASGCHVLQSSYDPQDFLNIELLAAASWKEETLTVAAEIIISALPSYMNSGGVALPPNADDDIVIYPLRS